MSKTTSWPSLPVAGATVLMIAGPGMMVKMLFVTISLPVPAELPGVQPRYVTLASAINGWLLQGTPGLVTVTTRPPA